MQPQSFRFTDAELAPPAELMSVDAEDVLTLAEEESSPDAPLPESEPQPANKKRRRKHSSERQKDLFKPYLKELSPMPTIYLSARQKGSPHL